MIQKKEVEKAIKALTIAKDILSGYQWLPRTECEELLKELEAGSQ